MYEVHIRKEGDKFLLRLIEVQRKNRVNAVLLSEEKSEALLSKFPVQRG